MKRLLSGVLISSVLVSVPLAQKPHESNPNQSVVENKLENYGALRQKVRDGIQSVKQQNQANRAKIKNLKQEIKQLMMAEKINEAEVLEKSAEISRIQAEMMNVRTQKMLEVARTLSPEERQKLQAKKNRKGNKNKEGRKAKKQKQQKEN